MIINNAVIFRCLPTTIDKLPCEVSSLQQCPQPSSWVKGAREALATFARNFTYWGTSIFWEGVTFSSAYKA